MLKNGLHRVTAHHGNLTHLIFVQPHSVVINCGSRFCKDCAGAKALAHRLGSLILVHAAIDAPYYRLTDSPPH
jgi:hypothetical protein